MEATSTEGNVTRPRLIEAGTRLFGEHNGHEVSNRMLAREAGVNHAAINYHFGSREGLCEAIFTHCLEKWKAIMLPIAAKTHQQLAGLCGRDDLGRITHELVCDMTRAVTGREGSRMLSVLFNEGLVKPKEFNRRMFEDVIQPFHAVSTRLAAAARGLGPDDLESMVLGQAIVAQCMTFFRGRILLLPRLNLHGFDAERSEQVAGILSRSIRASLGLPDALMA
ncbi:MAG: CerR family C-terminal domain-containing protein [Desulfovibrio sp.]